MSDFAHPSEPENLGTTLAEAVESLFDGTITADDHRRLEKCLARDASLRQLFVRHARLHAAICWDADRLCDIVNEPSCPRGWQATAPGFLGGAY